MFIVRNGTEELVCHYDIKQQTLQIRSNRTKVGGHHSCGRGDQPSTTTNYITTVTDVDQCHLSLK